MEPKKGKRVFRAEGFIRMVEKWDFGGRGESRLGKFYWLTH